MYEENPVQQEEVDPFGGDDVKRLRAYIEEAEKIAYGRRTPYELRDKYFDKIEEYKKQLKKLGVNVDDDS